MNANELTVFIDRATGKVEIIGISPDGEGQGDLSEDLAGPQASLQRQKDELTNLCRVLGGLVDNVNMFCEQLFSQHREAVAKLAVEIAARVLVKKIDEGDYKIEEIVKSALEKVTTHDDLKVHLNPKDCSDIQKLQTDSQLDIFKGISFISDSSVAPAECVIQTPKGIIKSMIEQQLERIGFALENAG